MAGQSSNSDDEMIAAINVTPLVDVMLVLLIIFMITAPVIYQSAIKVKLPQAQTGDPNSSARKSPLQFTLTREGKLHWDNQAIDWPDLDRRLKELGPRAAEETAMISADEATPHGQVVRLMDALRKYGLLKFALNVDSAAR